MDALKEFIVSSLPRFAIVTPEGRLQVVHDTSGVMKALYSGPRDCPHYLLMESLALVDRAKIETKLKAIKAEHERKANAWPWPTSDNPPRVKQVVNCWPFPVSTPPIEPDSEEQQRADDEIDAQHDADIKQADAVREKRMLAIVNYLDAWLPQRTLDVHDDLREIADEVKEEPHALTNPHHIFYDTYNDDVKIIVSLDHMHVHYQIVRAESDLKSWFSIWFMPTWRSTKLRDLYESLGSDIMMVNAFMTDADFQRNVDLCIKPLVEAVYKAADL